MYSDFFIFLGFFVNIICRKRKNKHRAYSWLILCQELFKIFMFLPNNLFLNPHWRYFSNLWKIGGWEGTFKILKHPPGYSVGYNRVRKIDLWLTWRPSESSHCSFIWMHTLFFYVISWTMLWGRLFEFLWEFSLWL